MDGARVYLEPYYDSGDVYVEEQTTCLIIPRANESEIVFEARVQAHVDILNKFDERATEDIGYDWEQVPIVA